MRIRITRTDRSSNSEQPVITECPVESLPLTPPLRLDLERGDVIFAHLIYKDHSIIYEALPE